MAEVTKKEQAVKKMSALKAPISAQDYAALTPVEKEAAEEVLDMEKARKLMPKKFTTVSRWK
jgi:hypothetical protein